MEEAEIIVKRSILQGSAARGGRRSLLRRGETPTAMTRPWRGPVGPWPDLRAYARQPARGRSKGEGVVVVGTCWVPCWPTVGAVLATLGLSLGSVGPS